ncbi:hypothetical protein [Ktedonobacter sp. SOSP1-85]|uniref:hypothetical protein n=1 Tax=Ktedonobacter sp. SOSP1-85 TaxID=2778367 RepID=UPI001915779C|nr:hypothetical protein [Ktedonobacter sp. SOSP1-85]
MADKPKHSSSIAVVLKQHNVAESAESKHNLAESADFASTFNRLPKPIRFSGIAEKSAKWPVWLVKSESEVLPERRNVAEAAKLCRESHNFAYLFLSLFSCIVIVAGRGEHGKRSQLALEQEDHLLSS